MKIWKKMWVGVFFWTQCRYCLHHLLRPLNFHTLPLMVFGKHNITTSYLMLNIRSIHCVPIKSDPLADFLIACSKVYRIEHNFMNRYPYVLQTIMHYSEIKLDDCSVNDRLIKVAQFVNQSFLQMVNVTNLVTIHSLVQNAPDRVVNR